MRGRWMNEHLCVALRLLRKVGAVQLSLREAAHWPRLGDTIIISKIPREVQIILTTKLRKQPQNVDFLFYPRGSNFEDCSNRTAFDEGTSLHTLPAQTSQDQKTVEHRRSNRGRFQTSPSETHCEVICAILSLMSLIGYSEKLVLLRLLMESFSRYHHYCVKSKSIMKDTCIGEQQGYMISIILGHDFDPSRFSKTRLREYLD